MNAALRNALTPTAVYGTDTIEETDMFDRQKIRDEISHRLVRGQHPDCRAGRKGGRAMTEINNGAITFDADELAWWAEHYGDTEWIAYFPGMDEITTHDRHYPGDEVDGEPFTEETVRAYLAEFDGRFGPGSPMAREVHEPSYAVALHHGVPAFGSHEHSYPINPPGGSFAYPGDCACGSPYSDVEEAQQREIAAIEWAVYVQGLGVLAREDNDPNSPLFTEETARRYAAWANAEMAWVLRGEANSAVVLHYGAPVETADA